MYRGTCGRGVQASLTNWARAAERASDGENGREEREGEEKVEREERRRGRRRSIPLALRI